MPGRVATQVDLSAAVPRIFDQVQTSTVNHTKNFIALHKLHMEAAKRTAPAPGGGTKLVGEREFEYAFMDMLARVLPVKKGATTADRVVKFVGGYIKFINDRGMSECHLALESLVDGLNSCRGQGRVGQRRGR